jgi:hypothetical protein
MLYPRLSTNFFSEELLGNSQEKDVIRKRDPTEVQVQLQLVNQPSSFEEAPQTNSGVEDVYLKSCADG